MPLAPPIAALALLAAAQVPPPGLSARLADEGITAVARDATARGDARRGARVFHRPALSCTSCHVVVGADGAGTSAIGPDLAAAVADTDARLTPERIVEALLDPSRTIRAGYETATVATADGRVVTGRLVARGEDGSITLRDPARPAAPLVLAADEVDELRVGGPSLMPTGLLDALADRSEALDLVAYLAAVAQGGPTVARELAPSPAELARALPAYESEIDHAGLIAAWDDAARERGAALYARVCANCHGTPAGPGSLPYSLKFWADPLKSGADPYRMYQTVTHGFGQMPPQSWLVPRQRYDVIHFIREEYFRPSNPSQLAPVDAPYLAGLPEGTTIGPEPPALEPWAAMDYGPVLGATIEAGGTPGAPNFAMKGLAARLDEGPGGVARGRAWALFESDTLRWASIWTGEAFLDWHGIAFDGAHESHPRTVGPVAAATPDAPGWADPRTGRFDDPRPLSREGRPYGPLPKPWARYHGRYQHGTRMVLSYAIGDAEVLDAMALEPGPAADGPIVARRTLDIGQSTRDLAVRVARSPAAAALVAGAPGVTLRDEGGEWVARIAADATPARLSLLVGPDAAAVARARDAAAPPEDLAALTHGGPPPWPEAVKTRVLPAGASAAFAVDELAVPDPNPWRAQVRPTGLDFLDDGNALALATWDGDVWRVDGLADPSGTLTWRRIASGLFQPLGLKVIDGAIVVACRDQIAILRDQNGDGSTDFYECFNTDHQVTEHFHEFAMGLQTDAAGNLYYAKAARHARRATVPQHGTLLKVSPDGSSSEILATGFRAPNGVCVEPDGTFLLTDQEGHWIPKNRLNRVRVGSFHGNLWGFTDVTDPSDAAMAEPICWITNATDRSPAEPLRVPPGVWGPLAGSVIVPSYGTGRVFVAPTERVDDAEQGGYAPLPIAQAPTGLIRGRFGPDGHLYACGMFAWAGNQTRPGGLYRVRHLGGPIGAPVGVRAGAGALRVTFTEPLDPATVTDPKRYALRTWGLVRSENYGSPHVDEAERTIAAATLEPDGRTVRLAVPDLAPTRGYALRFDLRDAQGNAVAGQLDGTIHHLGP